MALNLKNKINIYEQALFAWLDDNNIQYAPFDQHKRITVLEQKIKSFDLIINTAREKSIIAEVKGRKFRGTDITKSFLQCWATLEDIKGLTGWANILGEQYLPYFIFIYRLENPVVETDFFEIYNYRQNRFIFTAILLDDFTGDMKIRSPRWKTMTLPSKIFQQKYKTLPAALGI